MIGDDKKQKKSNFYWCPFEIIRFFCLEGVKMMILLTLRHFWKKSLNGFFIAPNEKLFCHKNFEIPCRDFNLAKYWNVLHNHYKWRVSTFESLHGISKFLWLNNFSLGAMKKSFHGFFQKCLSLCKIIILTLSRQKNLTFSKGHR